MAGKEIPLGPTGETVRANIARLRSSAKFSYAELSRRLEEAGRAIAPLGLRRIESGTRRVDVDDLVALAVVLGVNPNALLMPEVIGTGLHRSVTGAGEIRTITAWNWARGGAGSPAHSSSPVPRLKFPGIKQNAGPTLVLTDWERHRERARYVNERCRAVQEGRLWQMTPSGGYPLEDEGQPVSGEELKEDAAEVERLLDLDLTDEDAWSEEYHDPARAYSRDADDHALADRAPITARQQQSEFGERQRENRAALASGRVTRIPPRSRSTNG